MREKTPQPRVNQETPIDEARRHGKGKTSSDGVCEDMERREPCSSACCSTLDHSGFTFPHVVDLPRDESHYPKCPAVDRNSMGLLCVRVGSNCSVAWFGNIHICRRRAAFQSSSSAPSRILENSSHVCIRTFFFFFLQACKLYPCFQTKTEADFQTLHREIDTSVAI